MIDGIVARRTNNISQSGAKTDTIADIVFLASSLIKILPIIHVPIWLWIWFVVIAIIKIGNIILGYTLEKQFIFLHTITNKITGLLLFLLPFILPFIELKYSSVVVCLIATLSAIQEGYYIKIGRKSK